MAMVYGTTKPTNDNGMVHESMSPESVAEAVYGALVSGLKLPPLNDSKELKAALLAFEPPSLSFENEDFDIINGNKGESRGEGHGEDKPKCSRDSHKAGPSREDRSKKKPPSSSVLMLEALCRRRMDAVRQLHEVCPQLLASIPLFDRWSFQDSGSPLAAYAHQCHDPNAPMNYSHANPLSHSASASSSVVLTANTCQLHRSSRLLDLAAENQNLLVFVLQHHPEVNKQHRRKSTAQIYKKGDAYDSIGCVPDPCLYNLDSPCSQPSPSPVDSDALKRGEHVKNEGPGRLPGGSENKEDDEKKNGEADLLADLGPNNPIAICISKNNPEVLQYLLFKHVWQHFLLDEIFDLPHNSIVPDVLLGELVQTCPWFVHCASLMGCPQLLQLVLSGQFCNRKVSGSPRTSITSGARGIHKPDENETEENIRTRIESFLEDQEICESPSDEKSQENADSESSPQNATTDKRLEDTAAKDSGSRVCDKDAPPNNDDLTQAPLSSSSPDFSPNAPSCSHASSSSAQNTGKTASKSPEDEIASTSEKSQTKVCGGSDVLAVRSRSHSFSPQQQSVSLNMADPNSMFPVSLPIMDRWISRCMHVRLTPLHLACWRCDPASIKVLLNYGADVQLLAEELLTPEEQKEGQDLDTPSGQPGSTASAESSSMELSLNFVSVTVNSSSLDLTTICNSMEEVLKKVNPDKQSGLSPLAMLALGIRSPPDFSLSIGKSLGLVMPTLPELWGGQVDRSCYQAKRLLLEALHLLLEAGSDVNASSLVFGKSYRVLELFLQPSVDLYYAPLMPRGGRDSAVLRCMDLERVAEIVLSACWELCSWGGRLGPNFSSSMEWNLFRMDWMFLQNEVLQRRFLHLAIFLGLFPPLDPALYLDSNSYHLYRRTSASLLSREESQSSVGQSTGGTDLREPHLPPYSLPPRPSCVPWAPSTSRLSSSLPSSTSPAESEEGVPGDQRSQDAAEIVTSYYSTVSTQSEASEAGMPGAEAMPTYDVTPPISQSHFDCSPTRTRNQSSNPCLSTSQGKGTHSARATTGPGSGPVMKVQMIVWGLEERQRRCLERFVNEAVRLSMSQASLALVLRFLCLPDLHLLARITERLLQTSTSATENPLQRVHEAVCQAQMRTLHHSCKLAILLAIRWRSPAVCSLPLPDSLKRYLLDPY